MDFEPDIWGPKFWFVLMTIALAYPDTPNSVTKRKYYDLIINLPLFIPNHDIGDKFSQLLDKYPVSPYLDNRDSFVKWINFIHNKINVMIGKEEVSLLESLDRYNAQYTYKPILITESIDFKKRIGYYALFVLCLLIIYFYYQ